MPSSMTRQPTLSRTTSHQSSLSPQSSSVPSNAALWGAAVAFGRASPRSASPSTTSNPGVSANGALTAASAAGRGIRSPSPFQATSASRTTARAKSRVKALDTTSSSSAVDDEPTDTTPVAPTSALVKLFEMKTRNSLDGQGQQSEPAIIKPSPTLAVSSPKPLKSNEGITSMFRFQLDEVNSPTGENSIPSTAAAPTTDIRDFASSPVQTTGFSSDDSFASASDIATMSSPDASFKEKSPPLGSPRKLPLKFQTQQSPPQRPLPVPTTFTQENANPRQATSSATSRDAEVPESSATPSSTQPIPIASTATSRRPSFAPSVQSLSSVTNNSRSVRSIQAQYNQAYPRIKTPLTSNHELANALVASSLASSRAPSPHRLEPPPVPNRRRAKTLSPHHQHHHHHKMPFKHSNISRTPSPVKTGMLHTLRKQHTGDSDGSATDDEHHPYAKHQKKRLVRKHPNKHHEGDRKRWRDAVTERERKRYEGVWAANKGIHTPISDERFDRALKSTASLALPPNPADQVSNIVVRDIWSRSRLPDTTLAMVWDLVDNDNVGALNKDEFVVGLWLIDQRLKGRKLPVKVSDSVWLSVRALEGIKIRK